MKLGSIVPRPAQIGSEGYVLYSEEFIPGRYLRELINRGHRPTAQELATVGVCLLHAVGELSAMNVIHRDIKPENIMQAELPGRRYIVLDLGIAFQVGGAPITRDAGRIPGTLYSIAPEMLDVGFRQNLDYRADLYTIGLTLYEYASGRNPFKDPSDPPFSTLYRIKTLTPAPLASHRPDLPNEFCGLVNQLMKKIPALRPSGVPTLLRTKWRDFNEALRSEWLWLGGQLNIGLDEKLLHGGIFSPKDLHLTTMKDKIDEMRGSFPEADILIDPQFYVSLFADGPNTNAGHLPEWSYFRSYRKSELEITKTVRKVLEDVCGASPNLT